MAGNETSEYSPRISSSITPDTTGESLNTLSFKKITVPANSNELVVQVVLFDDLTGYLAFKVSTISNTASLALADAQGVLGHGGESGVIKLNPDLQYYLYVALYDSNGTSATGGSKTIVYPMLGGI